MKVINEIDTKLRNLVEIVDIESKQKRIEELTQKMMQPGFWDNREQAQAIVRELQTLKNIVEQLEGLMRELKDLRELAGIAQPDELVEIETEANSLLRKINTLELQVIMDDPDDEKDAILQIHPGAGGTESCDWASMLLRMYLRWAEREGFSANILSYEPGEVAGIKDAVLEIKGKYAYGYLRAEAGVHRLVRVSPFDANHRRHTSFAACYVYPAVNEDVQIDIKESDIKIQMYRSSGPGGQNVNKLNTAVRIIHIPTGITVTCQSERSQYQNRVNAMRLLRAKLYEKMKREQKEKLEKKLAPKHEIGWSYEIRSYVLHPYKLVKDHRTHYETSNAEDVLDGNLMPFIRAYLLSRKNSSTKISNKKDET